MAVPGFEKTIKPVIVALQQKGGKASVGELDEAVRKVRGENSAYGEATQAFSGVESEISLNLKSND